MDQKYSVLLAEDESLVLLGLKALLTQLGHTVVGEAYSGRDAVSLCNSLNPDLLIMDIKMPVLDGIQALEQINSTRSVKMPCIFISAYSDDHLIERAKSAGVFNYLVKPVRLEDLRVALNITMQQYQEYIQVIQERDQAKADLKNRKLIERAKGILMDNFDMKEKQAMEFMQKKARDSHKKLNVIAQGIISMDEAIK